MAGQLMHMSYIMWLEQQMMTGNIPSDPTPTPTPSPSPEPEPVPPEPIVLPPQTIRFRFDTTDYDPSVIENGGVWTKVDDSSFNDWDWYCEDTDWSGKFNNKSGYTFTEDIKVSILITGDMANITSAAGMFNDCTGLTNMSENSFPSLTECTAMFQDCTNLASIPNNAFPNLTNGTAMFNGCTSLASIPENAFPKLIDGSWMFQNCTNLASIPKNAFKNLVKCNGMFNGCASLTSIDANAFQNLSRAPPDIMFEVVH